MTIEQDLSCAKRTIDKEIEALRCMEASFGQSLSDALDLMQKAKGRIIITGMGKSGHIGKKIAATLASTGSPSFFVHPSEASHGDLGMLTEDDVVLAISNGGESKELSDILLYCKRYGIPLIAMTKNPESTLGKAGDILLCLPNYAEACPLGMAPTSSTTATLVLGDVLAVCLMERKGFSKTDYKKRHPGGKLGAMLLKVSDLMHKNNDIPKVNEDADMQEALLVMTSKMLGCVGVTNKQGQLIGIITDGDLRRCMSSNLTTKKVTSVMTPNPKVIDADVLAVEALNTMNNTGNGITQLFVLDEEQKPVGVIHIHDCLRAGVA
ncbi:MAG: KpsF/GutQ family sugar-phosphate isomerase [Alphaproteobacteria bacterium]|nr:KpsF/GutQ family sugar-phosphate isomerase [Alphaproteobacteria bacterium]